MMTYPIVNKFGYDVIDEVNFAQDPESKKPVVARQPKPQLEMLTGVFMRHADWNPPTPPLVHSKIVVMKTEDNQEHSILIPEKDMKQMILGKEITLYYTPEEPLPADATYAYAWADAVCKAHHNIEGVFHSFPVYEPHRKGLMPQ